MQIRPEMEGLLQDTGFIGLARMDVSYYDWHLITALVERWRPKTHTFHMSDGECTIALQNLAILTKLPIEGRPIIGRLPQNYGDLCQNLLRIAPSAKDI